MLSSNRILLKSRWGAQAFLAALSLGLLTPSLSSAQLPAPPATGAPGDLGTLAFPYVVGAPYQLNDANNPNSVWWQLRVLRQMDMQNAYEQANVIREMQGMLREWNVNLQNSQRDLIAARESFEPIVKERDKHRADLKFSERDVKDSTRALTELENRILAELPTDSPYIQAREERSQFLGTYDDLILETLHLPARSGPLSEDQITSERLRYTSEQKARLNESSKYREMTQQLPDLTKKVAQARQTALENNEEWKLANEKKTRLQKQSEDLKESMKLITSELNEKRKALDMARSRNLFAQQSVRTLQANLRKMGAGPGN